MSEVTEPVAKKVKVDASTDAPDIKLSWATIKSENTKNTAAFYEHLLGWKPDITDHSEHWLEVNGPVVGGTNIALHGCTPESGAKGHVSLTFTTKDLSKLHEHIKGVAGIQIVSEPKQEFYGKAASYKSAEGTEIFVIESVSSPPAAEKVAEKVEEKTETITKPSNDNGAGLCHVEIPCADVDRISKFFTDTFGWTFTKWGSDSFFKTNDPEFSIQGGLVVAEHRINNAIIYINVKSIETALEKVKENGGAVLKEKFELDPKYPDRKSGKFTDSEGNVWALYCDESKQKHLQ